MNGYNFTDRVRKVLQMAREEAARLNHSYVGTEHLLLGLLREEKGIAAQVLTDAGVNLEQARAETLRLLGSEMPSTPAGGGTGAQPSPPKSEKKSKTPALDHFCRDLTQLAAEGSLDPTIGRQKEIERVMEILSRRKKNNPVLIDELHTLVGAGAAEGAVDASNMLKPALARGELQCVGASTLNEYRKYIEKDGALERRVPNAMGGPPPPR